VDKALANGPGCCADIKVIGKGTALQFKSDVEREFSVFIQKGNFVAKTHLCCSGDVSGCVTTSPIEVKLSATISIWDLPKKNVLVDRLRSVTLGLNVSQIQAYQVLSMPAIFREYYRVGEFNPRYFNDAVDRLYRICQMTPR